jgi:hypothetical protein
LPNQHADNGNQGKMEIPLNPTSKTVSMHVATPGKADQKRSNLQASGAHSTQTPPVLLISFPRCCMETGLDPLSLKKFSRDV